MKVRTLSLILGLALPFAACANPETAPTVPDTIQEVFNGSLDLQGEAAFEFNLANAGAVTATLASVVLARPGPTTTAALEIGLGTPTEGVCNTVVAVTTPAGLTSQLTSTLDANLHCVRVRDVGNLTAPVQFSVRVLHP